MPSEYTSDYVVIGSGIAGLCFALEVASEGTVTILTKKEDFESNTNYAQGGIACVSSAEDSLESHVRDTLDAGTGLCNEDVVRDLVREGPPLVHQLIDWGVRFTTHEDIRAGKPDEPPANLSLYDLGREGGHSHRRILHSKDLTGREVERALLSCLRGHPSVTFMEHHIGIDLLADSSGDSRRCQGVIALDTDTDRVKVFRSPTVLLATGGLGRIYQHTTNPAVATGDGVAMGWRAGLPVANLEFVQFHPTSFYTPRGKSFLISEAVRGEGALLKRINGESFMNAYDKRGSLAPRDIVAQAIDKEMKKSGDQHVLLDCSNMTPEFFAERFPGILALCEASGVHPPREPIWVVPAAHYSCGGVVTNSQGRTGLAGLYATGEVAHTGVHGANRLASNSLLEALVFSHKAAMDVLSSPQLVSRPNTGIPQWTSRLGSKHAIEGIRAQHCRSEIRNLMWDYVGIVRKTDRLELARARLSLLKEEVEGYFQSGLVTESIIELRNMVQTAELVVESALRRHESRGLHFTLDYPEPIETVAHDTILTP